MKSTCFDPIGNNRIGNYVVQLLHKIYLDDDYEVGLYEIIYTKTWFNVNEDFEIQLTHSQAGISNERHTFKAGCYRDIRNLCNEINNSLREITMNTRLTKSDVVKPPEIKFDESFKRVIIIPGKLREMNTLPHIPTNILPLFGFNSDDEEISFKNKIVIDGKEIKGGTTAPYLYDLNAGIFLFNVYSDIVKPSIVGNTFAPLLRSICVGNTEFGGIYQVHYEKPIYLPVSKNEFETIEIDIQDDTGSTLKFETGRVSVVLYFRKKGA